jgi:hypothetical protein
VAASNTVSRSMKEAGQLENVRVEQDGAREHALLAKRGKRSKSRYVGHKHTHSEHPMQ